MQIPIRIGENKSKAIVMEFLKVKASNSIQTQVKVPHAIEDGDDDDDVGVEETVRGALAAISCNLPQATRARIRTLLTCTFCMMSQTVKKIYICMC